MPMLTTLRIRSPVAPVHAPERTRAARSAIRSSTSWTSGTTSWPSTSITASRGARSATCSTGRSSVTLMRSPRNIASARRATPGPLGERPPAARASRAVDAVLGVVEVQVADVERQLLAAGRIVLEEPPQVRARSTGAACAARAPLVSVRGSSMRASSYHAASCRVG